MNAELLAVVKGREFHESSCRAASSPRLTPTRSS
jgi:hypothetical protein